MMYALRQVVVAALLCHVTAFYLPGVNPKSFAKGEDVKLKVNKMTSIHTLLPMEYYQLPFCKPKNGPRMDHENLGEFLTGDRIESSPYELKMQVDMYCKQLCISNLGFRPPSINTRPTKLVRAIQSGYHNNWIVDNLPAASKTEDDVQTMTKYWQGFPIGFRNEGRMYIYNHVNIEIEYHTVETETDAFRVVRFTVEPFSIKHDFEHEKVPIDVEGSTLPIVAKIKNPIASCIPQANVHTMYDIIEEGVPQEAFGPVLFTYDVIWTENKYIKWASRWDVYLNMDNQIPAKVHWFSIQVSVGVIFLLTTTIAALLVGALQYDIHQGAHPTQELYGWKAVHSDVFRPPVEPMAFAALCGTGAQLLAMTLATIFFSSLGFMNPSRRGHLLMGELFLFVILGSLNGYVTGRLCRTFSGREHERRYATLLAALGLPGLAFGLFLVMNVIALAAESSDAVPFTVLLTLLVLWLGLSTPLVLWGVHWGYQAPILFPVATSHTPRLIPRQRWYRSLPCTMLMAGFLPFVACLVELFYIMSSVWLEYYYYVFGVLLVVFAILIVTVAEVTVLCTYSSLGAEDYRWWWSSFGNGGAVAIYVAVYSVFYVQQLQAHQWNTYFLYFGYMGLLAVCLFAMTGFVGFAASLWFNQVIFARLPDESQNDPVLSMEMSRLCALSPSPTGYYNDLEDTVE